MPNAARPEPSEEGRRLRIVRGDQPVPDPRGRVIHVKEYRIRGGDVYVAVDPTGEFLAYEVVRSADERDAAVARLWRLLSAAYRPPSGPFGA